MGGGWGVGCFTHDGFYKEAYGVVALGLPLMEPMVIAVDTGDGIAAVSAGGGTSVSDDAERRFRKTETESGCE